MRDVLAVLEKLLSLLSLWLRERAGAREEERRRAVAADGAGALIGMFGRPSGTSAPPAHSGQSDEDVPGGPAGRVDG